MADEHNDSQEPSVKDRERVTIKKIIKIVAFTVAAIVVVYLLLLLLERGLTSSEKEAETETSSYRFYEADYDENIYDDPKYMELDRTICYCDSEMGTTESIDASTLDQYDASVQFIYNVINSIIDGDYDEYISYLSADYLSENTDEIRFTPQKLYQITFSTYSVNDDDSITFKLDYMIYRNNGTYRTDVGSDAIRTQYMTIVQDGSSYKINVIAYYKTK